MVSWKRPQAKLSIFQSLQLFCVAKLCVHVWKLFVRRESWNIPIEMQPKAAFSDTNECVRLRTEIRKTLFLRKTNDCSVFQFQLLFSLVPLNSSTKTLAMPMGQMPVLEVDGRRVHQSLAMCRYVAKQVGVAGKDAFEDLQIDALVDTINEFRLSESRWRLRP